MSSNDKPKLRDNTTSSSDKYYYNVRSQGIYAGDKSYVLSGIPGGTRAETLEQVEAKYGKEIAGKLDRGEYVTIESEDFYEGTQILTLSQTSIVIEKEKPEFRNDRHEVDPTPYLTEDYDFHNEESAAEIDPWS